jgi:hypothetical protein
VGFGPGSLAVEFGPGSPVVAFGPCPLGVAAGGSLEHADPSIMVATAIATRVGHDRVFVVILLLCNAMEFTTRILSGLIGVAVTMTALDAAVRTFVLPRGVTVRFTRLITRSNLWIFRSITRWFDSYAARDGIMAMYAPITLLLLPLVWLTTVLFGFAALFYAATGDSIGAVMQYSGSALFTLGFSTPNSVAPTVLVYIEAAIGLTLLALLISYLPSMYGAFSRREIAVSRLSVRAGSPPSAVEMLERAHRAFFFDRLDEIWEEWELWFIELEETHTSLSILNFFRSPDADRSWVTAAGTVMDAASLRMSCLDGPASPNAALCVRSGFIALRSIASSFDISYEPDVSHETEISVSREEFDTALDRLAASGLALKADREQAWRDFVGWRANYDTVVLSMAALVMAPIAPWSSDRSPIASRGRRRR